MVNGTDTSTVKERSGQRIVLEPVTATLGPKENCQQLVWSRLVDFADWPKWLTEYRSVQRLDSGELGRGSQLETLSERKTVWTISHYEEGRRIDFLIITPGKRLGFCYRLEPLPDPQYCKLSFSMEFEFAGLHALLAPLHSAMEQKRGFGRYKRLFNDLLNS